MCAPLLKRICTAWLRLSLLPCCYFARKLSAADPAFTAVGEYVPPTVHSLVQVVIALPHLIVEGLDVGGCPELGHGLRAHTQTTQGAHVVAGSEM